MTAGANPAAAITSAAGEGDDPGFLPASTQNLRRQRSEIAPGVLHHLKEIRSRLFHGDAIHFAHLLRGDGRNFNILVREEVLSSLRPRCVGHFVGARFTAGVNPAFRRPSAIKGHFFISSQRNPERWFSIIMTIGPWSSP